MHSSPQSSSVHLPCGVGCHYSPRAIASPYNPPCRANKHDASARKPQPRAACLRMHSARHCRGCHYSPRAIASPYNPPCRANKHDASARKPQTRAACLRMHSARHCRYTAGTRRTNSRCETAVSCFAVASRRICSFERRPRILLCWALIERRWPTTSAVIWFCSWTQYR